MSRWSLWVFVLATGVAAGSYAAAARPLDQAEQRAGMVSTTACGNASATSGSAVLIGPGHVLAAAHVVIGATDLSVTAAGQTVPAEILRLDTRTDLAMLRVDGLSSSPVRLAEPRPGSMVRVVGAGPSGSFDTEVLRRVTIRIEEVRSTVRSSRRGFEIDERVALGDSGAGVFDDDGRLIGLVFGRSTIHDDRSFAVASEEISRLLDSPDVTYRCDPARHRVVDELSARQSA